MQNIHKNLHHDDGDKGSSKIRQSVSYMWIPVEEIVDVLTGEIPIDQMEYEVGQAKAKRVEKMQDSPGDLVQEELNKHKESDNAMTIN